jgi:hypothetical protein
MAGMTRSLMLALTMWLMAAGPVAAFGWGRSGATAARPAYAPVYYVPMPVVMVPAPCVPRMPAVAPLPRINVPPRQPFATPFPAPPQSGPPLPAPPQPAPGLPPPPRRQTTEPPVDAKRTPTITESRFPGEVAPAAAKVPAGRARVGFWNITGRDITLTIDGKARTVSKDRAVTFELGRSFAWQVDDGAPRSEQVPEGQNTLELVIRP